MPRLASLLGLPRRRATARASNGIALVHVAIADFLLNNTGPDFVCLGYEFSPDRLDLLVRVMDENRAPAWPTVTYGTNYLALNAIDIVGRGGAFRDVLHLLAAVGAVRSNDYLCLINPEHPEIFVHTDYVRRSPFGAWLAPRRRAHRLVLRLAVWVVRLRPWMTPSRFAWRFLLRPAILLLAAIGGLQAIRDWFGQ